MARAGVEDGAVYWDGVTGGLKIVAEQSGSSERSTIGEDMEKDLGL